MDRRNFLRAAVIGSGSLAFGGSLWREAYAAAPAESGPSPYGDLLPADPNGIMLPAGFTSRVVARSGQKVPGTSYLWHGAPDGGACFPDGSGWIYVSNAELPSGAGGVSAVRFNADGSIKSAYRILGNTSRNCAGGATGWNTWLSCEEVNKGYVYETDPFGINAAIRRDAMGRFNHEAAAPDPHRKVIYLTEDEPDGRFYRFRPSTWGDLSTGTLEVMVADAAATSGPVTWQKIPDPAAATTQTRYQVAAAKVFNGGEGCHYADGICWWTTKGDNRVWAYDAHNATISLTYDDSLVLNPPLTGVDNVTGASHSGDLYVAEDGGSMEICMITPDGVVAPFLRVQGQSGSELTGPAFSPDGRRLYFSSQRGTAGSSSGGITYEVTGPFRLARTNLAKGRPVTASSQQNTTLAAVNATDGNRGTRWSSQFNDPQWIQVDLGAVVTIDRVVLRWESHAKTYQIQMSADAANWTTIYATTSGDGSVDDLAVTGTGRYLRMLGTERATAWGYSLWEVEVYGPDLALNRPASASSQQNASHPATNAVDGSLATRWSSAFSDPQWIQIDLGAVTNIGRVILLWEAAYAKAYQIQTSSDGAGWTTLHTTSNGNGGLDDRFVSGTGRYLRVYATQRATSWGYSLWNIEVYGQVSGG